jgi:hypothetical protein
MKIIRIYEKYPDDIKSINARTDENLQ